MSEKKTEVITFRTDPEVKEQLSRIADHYQWSIAQTVNQICINYLINPTPGEIVIKSGEFLEVAKRVRQESRDQEKGVIININLDIDEENNTYRRYASISVLECSGLGEIAIDSINEMTEEEIEELQ